MENFFGKYFPNYLLIFVDTDENLDQIQGLSEHSQRTIFHEYTHFLQNLTGSCGFFSAWTVFQRIAILVNDLQTTVDEKILLPIQSSQTERQKVISKSIKSVCGSKRLRNIDDNTARVIGVKIYKSNEIKELTGSDRVDFIQLTISDKDGKEEPYNFGEIAISETMAFLMESKKFGEQNLENFPYKACKKLAEYLNSHFAGNDEFLFALCDLSLCYPYPGYAFYVLLLDLEREKEKIMKVEDINIIGHEILRSRGYFFDEIFEKNKEGLINAFHALHLYENPFFANLFTWFEYLIRTGYFLRRQDPFFMLNLYRDSLYTGKWNEIVYQLGFPQTCNNQNDRFFRCPVPLASIETTIEPFFLLALKEIEKTLYSGSFTCALLKFCRKSKNGDVTNYDCVTQPWNIIPDHKLCVYKAYCRIFGIDKKEIIFKTEM